MTPDNLKADFDEIFKGVAVPFFKGLGFKRKTQHFARSINDITQCCNVQKSQWNDYNESLSFTINLGFYSEPVRALVSAQPLSTDFPRTTDCFIQDRLGSYSHQQDHWYKLTSRSDRARVAEEVRHDLDNYLKPLLLTYQSLDDLKVFPEKHTGYLISSYSQIVLFMLTGQTQKGELLIRDQYKIAITPQTTTFTTRYPDGRSVVEVSKPSVNQHYIDSIERLAKHFGIQL